MIDPHQCGFVSPDLATDDRDILGERRDGECVDGIENGHVERESLACEGPVIVGRNQGGVVAKYFANCTTYSLISR